MQMATQKEHEWFKQLLGDWTFETICDMGPDQPQGRFKGTESVRSLGGFWYILEGNGEMPDGNSGSMIMTLGFDDTKGGYTGTWTGSMMPYLWVYRGEMDEAQNILALHAEGPAMSGDNKIAKYKDVIEIKSDTERLLSSHMQRDDGTWHHFMTATYRRV